MRKSIFRRINRTEYRQKVERYRYGRPNVFSMSKYKYFLKSSAVTLLSLPTLYGIVLSYLYDDHKNLYQIVTSWADPWLVTWGKSYIPAINNLTEKMLQYGYNERIPFAQHVLSVSVLLGVFYFIGTMLYFNIIPGPCRMKRVIAYQYKSGCISFDRKGVRDFFLLWCYWLFILVFWVGFFYVRGYGGEDDFKNPPNTDWETSLIFNSLLIHVTDIAAILFFMFSSYYIFYTTYAMYGLTYITKLLFIHRRLQKNMEE